MRRRRAVRRQSPPDDGRATSWISWATVAAIVLLWSVATARGWVSAFVLPSPVRLLTEFQTLVAKGYAGKPLTEHVLASLFRTFTGLGLGIAVGIPLGILMGYNRIASAVLAPIFSFLRPIPPIAFIPLMILYFGIGEFSKIALIFLAALYYVVLNASAGVRTVPRDLIRAGENMGLSRAQLFSKVVFWAALPHIMTGIKTATAVSWAIVVAAELIAAQAGLGFLVMDATTFFRVPDVYIGIIIIGLIGVTLETITLALDRRLLHWTGK
ncbi:MAG: ABC transporter permease [Armatimonadota bacterium]|nr:ABC transporter permease [Armatimonadota bacterium]